MVALSVVAAGTAVTRADTSYFSDYRYPDGTAAHAESVCATADLCGQLTLRGGDSISVYAQQTFGCELPILHIVRRRGPATLLSYELNLNQAVEHRQASGAERPASYGCLNTRAFVSFDRGKVRMAVFPLAGDSQLFVRFSAGDSQDHTNAAPALVRVR